MKRAWWVVPAGLALLVGLTVGVQGLILDGGAPFADVAGCWQYTGRLTVTGVNGERYREKLEGDIYISQQGPDIWLDFYLEDWCLYFRGMVGPKRLTAAAVEGEQSARNILDARVSGNGQKIRGRIRGVETYYDEGLFAAVSFKATRAPGGYY
jgi:hypothetical protein